MYQARSSAVRARDRTRWQRKQFSDRIGRTCKFVLISSAAAAVQMACGRHGAFASNTRRSLPATHQLPPADTGGQRNGMGCRPFVEIRSSSIVTLVKPNGSSRPTSRGRQRREIAVPQAECVEARVQIVLVRQIGPKKGQLPSPLRPKAHYLAARSRDRIARLGELPRSRRTPWRKFGICERKNCDGAVLAPSERGCPSSRCAVY